MKGKKKKEQKINTKLNAESVGISPHQNFRIGVSCDSRAFLGGIDRADFIP